MKILVFSSYQKKIWHNKNMLCQKITSPLCVHIYCFFVFTKTYVNRWSTTWTRKSYFWLFQDVSAECKYFLRTYRTRNFDDFFVWCVFHCWTPNLYCYFFRRCLSILQHFHSILMFRTKCYFVQNLLLVEKYFFLKTVIFIITFFFEIVNFKTNIWIIV